MMIIQLAILVLASCLGSYCCPTYSKKHIFETKNLPSLALLRTNYNAFNNKLQWAWFRRNHAAAPLISLKKQRGTVPFQAGKNSKPIELDWCRSGFLNGMQKMYADARASLGTYGKCLPGFVSLTVSWLRHNQMRTALSNKDGTFVVLSSSWYNSLLQTQLNNTKWYKP